MTATAEERLSRLEKSNRKLKVGILNINNHSSRNYHPRRGGSST